MWTCDPPNKNEQCVGADQTWRLDMGQKRAVKEEGIQHLH